MKRPPGAAYPCTLDCVRRSSLRFRTDSRRPHRVRPTLLMGSARITAWCNGSHGGRKSVQPEAACGSCAVGRGLCNCDPVCGVGGVTPRDKGGSGDLGRWVCLLLLLRSQLLAP